MNKKLATILSPVIIGGMIFSVSITAIAGTTTDQKAQGQQFDGRGHGRMGGQFEGQIGRGINKDLAASLVKEGIITQEVADKITSYMEDKNAERKAEMEKIKAMSEDERKAYFESQKASTTEKIEKKADWLSEMLASGILTQEQVDSITAYQQNEMKAQQEEQQAKRQEAEKSRMDSLVSAGIITQDTADAITTYNETQEESYKAEMEKLKAMTDDERKTYMESKKDAKSYGKKDQYAGLLEAGVLTQEQVDSIKAYDEAQRQANQEEQETKRQEQTLTRLDSLVSSGTITEDLKSKVIEFLNNQEETRNAEMEKVKAMTDDERKAYIESKMNVNKDSVKGDKISPLKGLVDDGTLTQDQADAVVKVLFQRSVQNKFWGTKTSSSN
ncbi:hypothetical protein [Desulfosporosinus sp. OT]|uniref:hypothetical protein n=1 Tax=Desulfosporosinus sp. OT TaxID=913865 RepID=UPI0002239E48|nr:hypothetical protein [Desulfosporosinus sp. OT]EGW39375.1 hypothetical protein DOT_2660 [Desulfosporosinus sp. OT]